MLAERMRTFNKYLRERFGRRVARISFTTGYDCPWNRCVFCNQEAFLPHVLIHPGSRDWRKAFTRAGERMGRRFNTDTFLAYFQSGTATFGDRDVLFERYRAAVTAPGVAGLIISTRPDYIDETVVRRIVDAAEGVCTEIWIELGLQSMHDASLSYLNRGHTAESYREAVQTIDNVAGDLVKVAPHLIIGIPGESERDYIATIRESLAPRIVRGVKFHHLQVHRNTALADMYEASPFPLYSADEYAELFARLIRHVPRDVAVLRMFASAPRNMLIGPLWDVDTGGMLGKIEKHMISGTIEQGDMINGIERQTETTS